MNEITAGISIFFSCFLFSLICTEIVRKVSKKKGFLSMPSADRYNPRSVALGGGIAIYLTILAAAIAGWAVVNIYIRKFNPGWIEADIKMLADGFSKRSSEFAILLLCITIMFVVGLVDDVKNLGPRFKLVIQFAVAFITAILADVRVEFFIESKVITSILSAFWIVLIVNAFNFLDNMDGACAGIAAITGAILFYAAVMAGQYFVGGLALILVSSLLGFLVFNFPPARIFAGDSGSMVIGFTLAALSLKVTYYIEGESSRLYPVFMPLICMAVPIYDFVSVTTLRIIQGKSPFVGDTQHFSHRLKRHGLSERQTVLTLYLATLCTALGGTFLYQVDLVGAVLIFLQTGMILLIIAIFESKTNVNG